MGRPRTQLDDVLDAQPISALVWLLIVFHTDLAVRAGRRFVGRHRLQFAAALLAASLGVCLMIRLGVVS